MERGIDINLWNTTLYHKDYYKRPYVGPNVGKLILRGFKWCTLRASSGVEIDRTFAPNYDTLKAGGLDIILYHWFNPKLDWMKQADTFLAAIGDRSGQRMVDCEDTKTIKAYKGIFTKAIGPWLSAAEAGIIYLNPDYMSRYWAGFSENWLDQYRVIVAHWRKMVPTVPRPWSPGMWYAFQYTEIEDGLGLGLTTKEAAVYVR